MSASGAFSLSGMDAFHSRTCWIIGKRYANVLPHPVSAASKVCWPAKIGVEPSHCMQNIKITILSTTWWINILSRPGWLLDYGNQDRSPQTQLQEPDSYQQMIQWLCFEYLLAGKRALFVREKFFNNLDFVQTFSVAWMVKWSPFECRLNQALLANSDSWLILISAFLGRLNSGLLHSINKSS